MSKRPGHTSKPKPGERGNPRVNSLKEILISYEGRDEILTVKPPNLSRGGMFINTSQSFPEGAILNLRFELLLTGAKIETRCEVRYCRPRIGVGVQFVGLSEDAGRAIEKELGFYERTIAGENPQRRKTKVIVRIPGRTRA